MSASPPPTIRAIHVTDLPALYRICHATGLNGGDASAQVNDPDLIGHVYAGPYAVLEPALAFVATLGTEVVGYILGTADTAGFFPRSEAEWFPPLRQRYSLPAVGDTSATANFVRALHRGHPPPSGMDLRRFPAHLHIDLLPQAQGRGLGRRLVTRWFDELRARGVPGAHLYVGRANPRAVTFYERTGFVRVDEVPGAFGYARSTG